MASCILNKALRAGYILKSVSNLMYRPTKASIILVDLEAPNTDPCAFRLNSLPSVTAGHCIGVGFAGRVNQDGQKTIVFATRSTNRSSWKGRYVHCRYRGVPTSAQVKPGRVETTFGGWVLVPRSLISRKNSRTSGLLTGRRNIARKGG